MTTPKLANLYENNELIDFYEMGNDSDNDDTNLGFDIPKRFTDFNKGFNNAEEFLALNDSLVERFPQFQPSIFEYIANNNSEPLDTTVNKTLDPANQNSGLYTVVSDDFKNNLSKFFELPEEDKTNIISTLKDRKGLFSDESWVIADLNNSELSVANQNIFKKEQPEISDGMLLYLGLYKFVTKGEASRKPRTRIFLENDFKKLTNYDFYDVIEGKISREVIETEDFQKGLNTWYNKHKEKYTIEIPEKSNLSPFTNQLQSFGYEVSGSVGLGIATAPMLKAGWPGIALYAITNGIGNYLLNEEAQQIRKGQLANIGEEGQTSEGEKIASLIVGAIPFTTEAKGLIGIRNAALQGGATTTAETTIRTLIEENRRPNAEETITALSIGTLFGGGFKGSLDFFSDLIAKYAGKSAAQIDADLSNTDKKKVNKMIKDLEKIKKKEEKKLNEKVARVDNAFDQNNFNIQDTRGKNVFYHGTAQEIPDGKVTSVDSGENIVDSNLYGNGFYTSDDLITGVKYQNKGKKQVLKPEIPIGKGIKRASDLPYGIQSDLKKLNITDKELNQLVTPGTEIPSAERLRELANQARQFPIDNPFSGGGRTNVEAFNKIANRLDELAANPPKKPEFKPVVYEITEKQPVKFIDADKKLNWTDETPEVQLIKKFLEGTDEGGDVLDAWKTAKSFSYADIVEDLKDIYQREAISKGEFTDLLDDLNLQLRSIGFGGVTHQGGNLAGKGKRLHKVKIYWDAENQIDIKKVDLDQFRTKTKDKPQINPEQVGDPTFTDSRVQNLINKGEINTTIKSRTETLDAAIHLKNDPNFKEIVNKVAKDRKINPSDEFQLAIALEITSLNNEILDVNQKLINALNVKNDKKEVTILVGNLIDEINKLDEFLADAIPLRSDQGSGLAIMQMPTEGLADMTPEKWNRLTEIEKKDWLKLKSGGIAISTDIANKDLIEISDAINNALKIYNETGDPKTLNKLVNTIKRVDGNYTKMNKLIKYGVLANIANADVINRPFRVINEVWLSAILYGPDTHLVNTLSSAIEGIVANSELYLDPKNLSNPRELEVAIKHSWNLLTGFDFALKGAMESFKLESNYFTGASKLDDFKDRIAFSMDGDGPIANTVNWIGKHFIRLPYKALTSEDAFFQGLSINASAYSGATLQGIQKGLKGKELQAYINKQAETIIETFATKTTKRINSLDPTQKKEAIELYETVKDFAKRSTFSEDLTGGGELNVLTKWLAEGSAKSPIVRRFIPFVRILKNLVGRQVQRTPLLGQSPVISGFYNDYVNGSPLLQKQLRGRVVLSTLTGYFVWNQMERFGDPNSDIHLTGGGPANREAWQKKWKSGWRPYSIGFKQFNEDGSPKIGADGNPVIKYYSFTRLDPISGLLMSYTDAYDVSKLIGDGEIDDALTHIAVSGSRNLTDRLFLQGINDFAKLIYEPKRAENWFARQVASNVPASGLFSKAKNLPGDLYDMGLLDWTGITVDEALQWKLELSKKVYKGDEGLAIANKILNQSTRTIPGWNNNLPPMREHITNNPIFKRQRPGFDLLTWFEVSESKNDPVLTVFSKLGKGVSEPTDTITTYGGSIDGQVGIKIEPVKLDTQQMSDLQYITNTIDINGKLEGEKGYNGRTLKKTMLQYMKTPWFKTNYEIIKDVKKPWRTHPEIVEAILNGPPEGKLAGFREINNEFKTKAKDKFLKLNPKILFKHDEAKKQSKINYIELLKKANERIEY